MAPFIFFGVLMKFYHIKINFYIVKLLIFAENEVIFGVSISGTSNKWPFVRRKNERYT